MSYECKICGRHYEDAFTFTSHIKNDHKLSIQDYYDKFLKKEGEGLCKICGKPTKFNGINKGYSEYCSKACSNKFLTVIADSEIGYSRSLINLVLMFKEFKNSFCFS